MDDKSIFFSFMKNLIVFILLIMFYGCLVVIFNFQNEDVRIGIRVIQFTFFLIYLLFMIISSYYINNKYYLFVFTFIFQTFLSFSLYIYYNKLGLSFGYDANDALVYQDVFDKTKNFSIFFLIDTLKTIPRLSSFSDWGFPIYRFFIYKLLPIDDNGLFSLIFFNTIVQTSSSYFVYRIAQFFLSTKLSYLVALFWGLSITSIYINTSGLKETIFSFFTVLSVHSMLEILLNKKKFYFFPFIITTFMTALFRIYVTLFIFIAFLGSSIFKKIYNKLFFSILVFFVIFSYIGLDYVGEFIPALKFVKSTRYERLESTFGSVSSFNNFLNFCFAWITPLVRVNHEGVALQYIISPFAAFKSFFSLFGIYGIFICTKEKKQDFYPIILVYFFNTILIIVTCNSLDYRFTHMTTFIDFILILYGYQVLYINNGLRFLKKRLSLSFLVFIDFFVVFLITFMYNR